LDALTTPQRSFDERDDVLQTSKFMLQILSKFSITFHSHSATNLIISLCLCLGGKSFHLSTAYGFGGENLNFHHNHKHFKDLRMCAPQEGTREKFSIFHICIRCNQRQWSGRWATFWNRMLEWKLLFVEPSVFGTRSLGSLC
jgi:hypothetical protein